MMTTAEGRTLVFPHPCIHQNVPTPLCPSAQPHRAALACVYALQEAYEGQETRCVVEGLTPGTAYTFCVKARYADATSHQWSQPIMVTAGRRAGAAKR